MSNALKPSSSLALRVSACRQVIELVLDGRRLRESIKECGMTPQTFQKTLAEERELAAAYARAQELHADLLADEIVGIADSAEIDPVRARNMIDARKWVASKKAPKTYGDRIDLNVSQTIDVLGTVTAARARLLRPDSDQQADIIDVTPIESSTSEPERTDNESGSQVPDIFS